MSTDIRDTLHEIGGAVAPPHPDLAAFDGRVRRVRRRRRLGQAAAATSVAAVLGVAAWVVAPGPPTAPDPTDNGVDAVPARSAQVLAFAREHRLFVSTPGSPALAIDTGLRVEELIARVPDGVVYVDPDSHLKRVDVRTDGTVGRPVDLVGPDAVQWAAVDATDTTLWYVDLDDVLHSRSLQSPTDGVREQLSRLTTVAAVGPDSWVSRDGDGGLALHRPEGHYDVEPYFRTMDVEIAGNTMAVVTDDGTETWSARTGERLMGSLGGSTAALSPDGEWVASGADQNNIDIGMSPGLWLFDTDRGRTRDVRLPGGTGPVTDIWWEDTERYFVVVDTAAGGRAGRTLYECTVDAGCRFRFDEESGTLRLPVN